MHLTSSAFPKGGKIPTRFTCDGADASPPLAWSDAPKEARSFAIVCSDPDAPKGVWFHWAIFDIPRGSTELAEHCAADATSPPQARNDFGNRGYGGPCPPRGHGRHHYHFKLFALDVARLDVPATASCREVEEAAQSHVLATTELVGVYSR
jgi:Raf kinase inhibitor-like YbhB/YbcL family protein